METLSEHLGLNEHFGYVLQFWRESRRMGAEEVSLRTGRQVSSRHLRRLEAGLASSSYDTYFHLRRALGLTKTGMWLPFLLSEERVPLHRESALAESGLENPPAAADAAPRYNAERDERQYAVELCNSQGILGVGSLFHLSPRSPVETGDLALAFSDDGAARLFHKGSASEPDPETPCHKVLWVQLKKSPSPDLRSFRRLGINEHFGYVLRFWRKKLGLSGEDLARRTGGHLSSRHLRRLEAGEAGCSYETFFHLREALGLTTLEMWMRFFLDEEQLPLYSGWFLSQEHAMSVNFFPGKSTARYLAEREVGEYALRLERDRGLLRAGTVLHLSPSSGIEAGDLALGRGADRELRLFRKGYDAEAEDSCRGSSLHRVLWIQP